MTGRRTWLRAARLAVGCALLLGVASACTATHDHVGSADVTDPAVPAAAGLETGAWSVLGGTLSVLVRNRTDQVLQQGDATVRALDGTGTEVATSTAVPDQVRCCTATHVPPGGTYALSFPVGKQGGRIDSVQVAFSDVAWSRTTDAAPATATPVRLYTDATGAVAVVDVTVDGTGSPGSSQVGQVGQVVVQARLDGPDGRFLVVASGTGTCLRPDGPSRMFLQLYQPVPDGTTIASVEVFAAGSVPATSCRSSRSARSWRARR